MPGVLRFIAIIMLLSACALPLCAQKEKAAGNHAALDGLAQTQEAATDTTVKQNDAPYRLKRGDNEFGVWGGVAFQATTIFGGLRDEEARDRKFVIAAFHYGRTLAANKNLALQYALDVIPVAVATGNIVESMMAVTPAGTVTTFRRESTYGAGLTPLGLQLDFANNSRVKPFIHVGGGFLIFSKSVPLPDAGRFSYVGEGSTGLRIFTSARRALSLGVRLHHISNGNRAGANRGLNEFILFAGFSIFK